MGEEGEDWQELGPWGPPLRSTPSSYWPLNPYLLLLLPS